MALSAIVQIYGEEPGAMCLKRSDDGTPIKVTGEIYSLAKNLEGTEAGLTAETLINACLVGSGLPFSSSCKDKESNWEGFTAARNRLAIRSTC